jgi:Rrf2 family cysteine metabolism transcriptional repressor
MKKNGYYQISQKSRYALRALLELALLGNREPVGVKKLAEAQEIPTRFLEVILSELRQGGFVVSIRGKNGGFMLARKPGEITTGEVIQFVESINHVSGQAGGGAASRIKRGDFSESWLFDKINAAISGILDTVTLEDMVQQEMKKQDAYASNYVI